jgi:hypothetical protein
MARRSSNEEAESPESVRTATAPGGHENKETAVAGSAQPLAEEWPIHPETGMQAIGRKKNGDPIWPSIGGSEDHVPGSSKAEKKAANNMKKKAVDSRNREKPPATRTRWCFRGRASCIFT